MSTTESRWRERIAEHGHALWLRGYVPGSSGNISVRLDDGFLVTPTNSCMGRLDPACIAKIDFDGRLVAGDPPSKEAFLHRLMYRERPADSAVVHLHSTHSVAVSCLDGLPEDDVLPPITAYSLMRIGKLPLVPYFRPGDPALAEAVAAHAGRRHAVLLANHGPVVAGRDLDRAVYAIEELEETAKLFFLLRSHDTRLLTAEQVEEIERVFGS